jgi:hypothetical protein
MGVARNSARDAHLAPRVAHLIHQSPAPNPLSFGMRFDNPEEWRRETRDGVELEVRRDPNVVRLVRDGVHVQVYGGDESEATLEQLIAVAVALRPID